MNEAPPPPDMDDNAAASGLDSPAVGLPRPPATSRTALLREIAEVLLTILAVYALINLLSARFIVDGDSMQPSFATGQYVLVNRLSYLFGNPARGDVVVFNAPGESGSDYIKRIIGLPGESIDVRNQTVYIDGVALDEPYILAAPRYSGSWTLGPDEFFVLGDNRNDSRDSHQFGPLTRAAIIGKAGLVYWPLEAIRLIPHHTYPPDAVSPTTWLAPGGGLRSAITPAA